MKKPMFTGIVVVAGAMVFATAARAQDSDNAVAHPPAPSTAGATMGQGAGVYGPPGAAAYAAPGEELTTTKTTEPNKALMGTGITLFAASYIPSVIVAATSPLGADQHLYIPLAGPWMDLASRPGCNGRAVGSCNFDTANKTLLTVSGIAQGAGALTALVSMFVPQHETVATKTQAASASPIQPTVHFSPAEMGAGGAGVSAFGTW